MASILRASECKEYSPAEVREHLRVHGVTPYKFAQWIGIPSPSMYNYLSGKQRGSRLLRIRIAEILADLEEKQQQQQQQRPPDAPSQPPDVTPQVHRL